MSIQAVVVCEGCGRSSTGFDIAVERADESGRVVIKTTRQHLELGPSWHLGAQGRVECRKDCGGPP